MALNYQRVGWEDAPSTNTPLDAANLNHMDNGIVAVSNEFDRVIPGLEEIAETVSPLLPNMSTMIQDISTLQGQTSALATQAQRILGNFATVEEGETASANYSTGQHVVLGDYLYKVIDDIAQGESFVESTNVEKTTVGSEIDELNSNLVSDTASDWWNPNISANNWQVAGTWTVPKSGMWIISVSKIYTSGRPIGVSVNRSNGTVLLNKEVDGSVSGDWTHLYNVVGFARLEKDEVISFYGKNSGAGKNDISFKAARVGL